MESFHQFQPGAVSYHCKCGLHANHPEHSPYDLGRVAAELRAKLEASEGHVKLLQEANVDLIAREAEASTKAAALEAASTALASAMETRHVCQGSLSLDDAEPAHCENCSGCCDDHNEPECVPLHVLHGNLKRALRDHGGALAKHDARVRGEYAISDTDRVSENLGAVEFARLLNGHAPDGSDFHDSGDGQ